MTTTNSTSEREQRKKQLEVVVFPETGRIVPPVGAKFVVGEITPDVLDFHGGNCTVVTLSLLDSEAADGDDVVRPSTRQGEAIVKQARENAATRMRDLCVEKVKDALLDHAVGCGNALYCDCGTAANRQFLIEILQSLTLEQEQK